MYYLSTVHHSFTLSFPLAPVLTVVKCPVMIPSSPQSTSSQEIKSGAKKYD